MAIQQVGGQGVYVITGSGRDPRKTSSGQSWADLVTQQKYMLIKQAQADAKQRIDREYADFDARQKAYQSMQADIRKQIEAAKGDVSALRLKEAEAQIRMKELQYKEEAERARGRKQVITSGDGSRSGSSRAPKKLSKLEFEKSIEQRINLNDKAAESAFAAIDKRQDKDKLRSLIQKKSPEFYTEDEALFFKNLNKDTQDKIERAQGISENAQRLASTRALYVNNADNPSEQRRIIDEYQGAVEQPDTGTGTSSGGTQYRTERFKDQKPVPETPGVDYGSMITPLEERIRSLEQQLISGQAPTAPDLNQTDLMRQIATEDYGLRSSYRPPTPAPTPTPTSETEMAMDVLGASGPDGLYPRDAAQSAQIASLVADPVRPPTPFTMQENVSRGVVEEARPRESLGGLQANQFEFQPSVAENVTPEPEPDIQPYIRPEIEPRIQPRPMQTEIGDALRQEYTDRVLTPPTPTPTGIPRPTGSIQELYDRMLQTQKKPTLKQEFDPVKFGTPMQKKQLALEMIMQKAQELGPSNPAYLKFKDQVIQELDRVLDPKKYRQIKMVEKNQAQNRGDYMALSKQVRGLNETSARLVSSLFPVNEETKADDADRMYKNAQKQIRTNIPNSLQQKKSNEFLDLIYLAYMQEK